MFLVDIRKTNKRLELHTNTGGTIINEVGELPGVGTVWVHQKGIANILSFHNIQNVNGFEIDYTSRPNKSGVRDNAFYVETPDKIHRKFVPGGRGFYYLDYAQDFGVGKSNIVFGPSIINTESNFLTPSKPSPSKPSSSGVSLQIETVVHNVLRAELVRHLQHIAAHPSDKTIIHMATKNTIKDSPIVLRSLGLVCIWYQGQMHISIQRPGSNPGTRSSSSVDRRPLQEFDHSC